ncbi:type II toxin-antitoxin system PemK/MazF family toxin [Chroogloeocystis siderophila]|uniref:mRNA-degrading endonuclease n=1 Tax=Chroogloeocystis siderophila 5.2 s.c.1 TaxID=247279 RepID=A0A1U7HXT1_9CHRO|nr:type II toxin-antitoxin system PemK/MazF family toxin [Chroogloeocystis siderophila]OKH28454.1 mRNA-degrading endonuclease [Chroogloeocystis siderophila 5.2 s.c.1]
MKSGNSIYVPDRGHIVYLNFSPHRGREQGYERPAIILSPIRYNRMASLALMCPITNQSKGLRFEVQLTDGMQTTGVILSDQIKSFDWKARQARFVEKASAELVEEVLAKVETLLS